MTERKYTWHKIADTVDELDLSKEGLGQIVVNGKTICVAKHNNVLFASTQKCPHAGGILADGFIDAAGNIVCPLHRYRYSLKNGRNLSGEGYFLKTFPVEVRNEGVFVAMEESGLFNWLK